MSCCAPDAELTLDISRPLEGLPSTREVRLASRSLGDGINQTDLSVPTVHCGACIQGIEAALGKLDGVESVRVTLHESHVASASYTGRIS